MPDIAGLKLIVPTSVTAASGTATVSASGKVTFTTATTVSVNGCFTASYDNYLIVMRYLSSGATYVAANLRLSGTNATGSNYTYQLLTADSTTVAGSRVSNSTLTRLGYTPGTNRGGMHVHVYGPGLAQATALRSVHAGTLSGAEISDYAATHSLATAYDGITIYPESGSITGALTIYGLSQ